ncbi:MAG: CHASE2 domain-containing protein [Xanthobacteraceae bacterium]
MSLRARPLSVAVLGGGCLAAAMLLWASGAFNLRENIREQAFDHALPLLTSPSATSPVVVVDIDRESLARYGAWPWRRLILADLVRKIAEAKPRVIGIDILLSEPDRFSPGGLVRNLGTDAEKSGVADLASKLPDGDAALADALREAPAVLGFVLEPGAGEVPPGAPILARGPLHVPDIWAAGSAIGPVPEIAAAARGFGAIVLADDADGNVRRVPLLVLSGDRVRPGFAAEVLRVGYDASSFIADVAPQRLHIGPLIVPIDSEAALRILPRPTASWMRRTVSAARILADEASRDRLAGRIALVGSGAPEVGGLRATPISVITPSVQIQADAIETLSGGIVPRRPPWVSQLEIVGALALGLAALGLAILCRPVTATAFAALLCLLWGAAAVMAFRAEQLMVDMAGPPAIAIVVFAATTLGSYTRNERRGRALRRRFEQHLAPDIVKRLVDAPDRLRLDGEARQVTAMFTDIEGFTALTERSDARAVLKLLDGYLAIVTDIVIEHGGMVDKLIGDGVFALFNVPLDLPNHVERSLAAAQAIVAATESYRKTPLAADLALGRTRIGIESGAAIVGDVGGGNKVDFTALGSVVNTASRLEGLNKEFNTSICIGPSAAAALGAGRVERLAAVKPRGSSTEMEVFTIAGWRANNDGPSPATKSTDPLRKADAI